MAIIAIFLQRISLKNSPCILIQIIIIIIFKYTERIL